MFCHSPSPTFCLSQVALRNARAATEKIAEEPVATGRDAEEPVATAPELVAVKDEEERCYEHCGVDRFLGSCWPQRCQPLFGLVPVYTAVATAFADACIYRRSSIVESAFE